MTANIQTDLAIRKLTERIATFSECRKIAAGKLLFHGTTTNTPGVSCHPVPRLYGTKWLTPDKKRAYAYPFKDLPITSQRDRIVFTTLVKHPLHLLVFPPWWPDCVMEFTKPITGEYNAEAAWRLEREIFPGLVKLVLDEKFDGAISDSEREVLLFHADISVTVVEID